jgi:hypothetical protein
MLLHLYCLRGRVWGVGFVLVASSKGSMWDGQGADMFGGMRPDVWFHSGKGVWGVECAYRQQHRQQVGGRGGWRVLQGDTLTAGSWLIFGSGKQSNSCNKPVCDADDTSLLLLLLFAAVTPPPPPRLNTHTQVPMAAQSVAQVLQQWQWCLTLLWGPR